MRAPALLGLGMLLLLAPAALRAEYRAYDLEVIDILDCRLNKLESCKRVRVKTAMDPDLYTRTHGGEQRIGVVMLATWICRGDTSNFKDVCPTPAPRKPKFSMGDEVRINLKKHITEGWRGKVEVAYYQRSVNSNVYGVRFADKQEVYARYFEKDLVKMAPSTPQSASAASPAPGGAPVPTAPGGAQ